jgi:Amt family ammonium transporter
VLCALAVGLKYKFGYDDSLDVVGVHLVAGLWGTIGAGLLATSTGLFYGGGWDQLVLQILIALISLVLSLVLTYAIAMGLKATLGWRISEDEESEGIDQTEHAESAYEIGGFAASSGRSTTHRPAVQAEQAEGANA